jgi:hypothetical protein
LLPHQPQFGNQESELDIYKERELLFFWSFETTITKTANSSACNHSQNQTNDLILFVNTLINTIFGKIIISILWFQQTITALLIIFVGGDTVSITVVR